MFHGRNDLGQRVLSGVDLMIDFATLGEYGLEPLSADGSCRERADRRPRPSRRPGWEALATTRRRARGHAEASSVPAGRRRAKRDDAFAFERRAESTPVDFRSALERYAG